ncbi:conserved hypothetical protein [Trichinella spiralis]|uniref:hypothetical protein n=1 Tax=Trichinella spiralis TaxID=6334 RepID=UPI0001EFBFCA|nr:conserved hypothetical protein [Trichinella spiralis]
MANCHPHKFLEFIANRSVTEFLRLGFLSHCMMCADAVLNLVCSLAINYHKAQTNVEWELFKIIHIILIRRKALMKYTLLNHIVLSSN